MVLFACTLHGFLGHEWQQQQMSYHPFVQDIQCAENLIQAAPKPTAPLHAA
jgi:hypothetical protein